MQPVAVASSRGAAQVRAARAAAPAGPGAQVQMAPSVPAQGHQGEPGAPLTNAAPAVGQQQAAAAAAPAAANKINIVVADVVEDRSVKRVTSSGSVVYKQYRRGRYLGKGGFAKCYELVSCDSHRTYAGKVIPKLSLAKASAKRKLVNEIKIHRSISHTHVVKFERFFEDTNNVYILLELCTNHTLMELVKRRVRLTETETQYYMWQLVNTMIFLHGQNVIHRDLKLGNLFLNENLDIRIGDFGLAAQLENAQERKRTICGTPNYIAPEILDTQQHDGHSFEVDVWAMGVIMFTLLIGQPPFETASVKTTYKRIRDNSYSFPDNVPISSAARNLITRILATKPSARPSLDEIRNDAFFSQSPFPAKLPLSIAHTPLQWAHTCHPGMPEILNVNVASGGPVGQENVGAQLGVAQVGGPSFGAGAAPLGEKNGPGLPLAANSKDAQLRAPFAKKTDKVVNAPVNGALNGVGVVGGKNPDLAGSKPALSRPATALPMATASNIPVSTLVAPIAPAVKISSPGQVLPAAIHQQAARLSGHGHGSLAAQVTPITIDPLLCSNVAPSSSPTYVLNSAEPGAPGVAKPFFKELAPSTSTPVLPTALAVAAGAAKRISGERRVTRRTSGEEAAAAAASASAAATAAAAAAAATAEAAAAAAAADEVAMGMQRLELGAKELPPADADAPDDAEDAGALRKMHDEIERSFCVAPGSVPAASSSPKRSQQPLVAADLWVNKWVDYSNKYGLGYLLSNGDSGVYFNDSSKAVLHREGDKWEYHERRSSSAPASADQPEVQAHTLSDFPAALQKKVTLLKHFQNYLVAPGTSGSAAVVPAAAAKPSSSSTMAAGGSSNLVYVKKWLRTKHAIFFRLSNRTVQVIFLDHTELLLSTQHNSVTYTDKAKKRETFALDRLNNAAASPDGSAPVDKPDLAKRMKYTKDILSHLLSRSNGGAGAAPADKK